MLPFLAFLPKLKAQQHFTARVRELTPGASWIPSGAILGPVVIEQSPTMTLESKVVQTQYETGQPEPCAHTKWAKTGMMLMPSSIPVQPKTAPSTLQHFNAATSQVAVIGEAVNFAGVSVEICVSCGMLKSAQLLARVNAQANTKG